MPCSPARARELLRRGRARVHRLTPFTVRLIDREFANSVLQPLCLKLDPGSRTTGIALVRTDTDDSRQRVLWLAELEHRGAAIHKNMASRAQLRRGRRSRKLRYRAPRFKNRTRTMEWLAPSLRHRVETTESWVARLRRLTPITRLAQELVRFDMQAIENPEVAGVEYQQGELAGYEVREYLLEKRGRACAYCDAENVPLQVEHILARSHGGSDRVSNLTLACEPCNQRKGAQPVERFLAGDPERLARINRTRATPLNDAAAVNTTRWALWRALKATGLPVEVSSGGRTKFNRARQGVPKTHALDAACVGAVSTLTGWNQAHVLVIRCTGRGAYQRTRVTKHGFPRGILMRAKTVHGFRTGDHVRAVVPTGKKQGVHQGRVAVRATGYFNIQTPAGVIQGVSHRHCRLLARGDGYGTHQRALIPALKDGVSGHPRARAVTG